MNRFKLLAAAMLLALPIISACGEDPPIAPPTGTIDGLVSIEGQGLDGVSVTLSSGAVATTANGGMFRFDGVEAGAYTVTISSFPDDATFNQTSSPATIASDGETVTINFPGTWIRTAAIMGTVTVENEGLSGVTVKLTGMSDSETLTDANGQYAFTGLRKGNYTVEISGFDEDDVAFGSTATTAELAVGESKVVPFEGTYLRTAAITGQVSVEGVGLENVTVSMQGRGEERTATTNSAGQYTFSELRSGDYSVGITNPDPDNYGFDVTSKSVTIAHGETGNVPFEGILLRTASIMGTVTVEGVGGIEGVMVSIQGEGHEDERMTNAAGQFSFTELHAGDYSVGITGFDDDLYGFEVTTATVTVTLQETATVPFAGIELRTAGIEGTITVEDHPIPGVTVTVTGGPKEEEHTRVTNDAGYYMVDRLHAGTYTITISDFDANEYEFVATSTTTDVGLRETATVAFQGDLLRTAGISGRVSVEGMGLNGINVTLSGDADMTMMTADGGQYAFTGLAAGDYTVEIDGYDMVAYMFETTTADLAVEQDSAVVQNFEGMHTRTAVISGMLFIDGDGDGMHSDGEPALDRTDEGFASLLASLGMDSALAAVPLPLILRGPGLTDENTLMVGMPDGTFAIPGLTAGSYNLQLPVDLEIPGIDMAIGDIISALGFRYSGDLLIPIQLKAADTVTVNIPFEVTMQTIVTGAVMGYGDITGHPVKGVGLAMFATAEDAADTTATPLAKATTNEMGAATFNFERDDDHGPGGHGTDNLVFVKVTDPGHADLMVSDNAHIEIAYPATSRVHHDVTPDNLETAAKLVNVRANFQWWIKSNEDAVDGGQFLEHWKVVIGTDTIASGADGKGSHTMIVPPSDKPATVMVMVDSTQTDSLTAMGEEWVQSDAPTYTHNPLALPAMNTAEMNDLGPIYITWTTQTLVVGVYREQDDVEGYIGHSSHREEDDHRPSTRVAAEMDIEVQKKQGPRNRWERYEWYDHDDDPDTDPIHPNLSIVDGLVMIRHLPATEELAVEIDVGQDRMLVTGLEYVETFGDALDDGMTYGSFGPGGGGVPEVRLCTASLDTSITDDDCATFGYQWMTGELSGKVGAVKGLSVDLEPVTENHDADDDDTKTGTGGAYSFDGLQDGTYDVTAKGNDDWSIVGDETQRVWIYHDEFAEEDDEDKADSAWVGTRGQAEAMWRVTQEGLEIRGYVANVDHEYNKVVRGDETFEGAVLHIHELGSGTTKDGIPPMGEMVGETVVEADGSYKFTGLSEGSYVIAAVDADDYEALQSNPKDNVAGPATADGDYVDVDEQNETLALPFWDYVNSTAMNITDAVTVGTGASAKTFTFHNFALLHKDGTFSGAVREASGRAGNIAVELRRCLIYTAADTVAEGPDDDVAETCSDDTNFTPDLQQTTSGGSWSFSGLREGYYQVNIAATGFNRAKWNADGIDDDAADCEGGAGAFDATNTCDTERTARKFDLLKGKTAFNRDRAVYYIYNGNLSSSDAATAVAVTGVTSNGADASDLAAGFTAITDPQPDAGTEALGATNAAVTYDAESIRVSATVPSTASYVIINETATGDPEYTPSTSRTNPGASVPLTSNRTEAGIGPNTNADINPATPPANDITVRVTAQNGYNDHDYTFTATRANPIGNQLEAAEVLYAGTNAQSGDGSSGTPFLVVTASSTANSVLVTFDLEELAGSTAIDTKCAQSVAVWAPGADEAMTAASDADADFCSGEQYTLTAGTTGTTYRVIITSEDGRDWTYYVNVSRGA